MLFCAFLSQIWQGHNIIDFVDPDIDAKLAELELEENELEVGLLCCCLMLFKISSVLPWR